MYGWGLSITSHLVPFCFLHINGLGCTKKVRHSSSAIYFVGYCSFITADGLSTQKISSSTTSLTISWTLENTLTATAYTISYTNTNTHCFSQSDTISGIVASQTMYTLTGLEEGTEYSITVTASLTGGRTAVDITTTTTITAG